MPKIMFSEKFDWTDPRFPQVTVAYKANHTYMVTTPCANAAIAKGKARPAVKPQEPEQDDSASISG